MHVLEKLPARSLVVLGLARNRFVFVFIGVLWLWVVASSVGDKRADLNRLRGGALLSLDDRFRSSFRAVTVRKCTELRFVSERMCVDLVKLKLSEPRRF
jgi:hypothetical protein